MKNKILLFNKKGNISGAFVGLLSIFIGIVLFLLFLDYIGIHFDFRTAWDASVAKAGYVFKTIVGSIKSL